MEASETTHFGFPVGYYSFHPKQLYNFQLNRWHSLGYLPYDAMVEVGKRVSSFGTWMSRCVPLLPHADHAERGGAGRLLLPCGGVLHHSGARAGSPV